MELSIVVPLYNEEDNIVPLLDTIDSALKNKFSSFEVVLVDDGSSDSTIEKVLKHSRKNTRLVKFARNFGQTSAMSAGIFAAKGRYIATMDGDLQNDATDIPLMIKKLEEENIDIVAGIRKNRKDGAFLRKIPSKLANWVIRKISNVNITDYGCTLKVFKSEIAKQLDLYGELHRFIPILGNLEGAKISEMDVKHHARQFGESKYGIGRTFKVISDILLMTFFIKYRQKPMHLFGTLGASMFLLGGAIETYLLFIKILGQDIGGRPLFYIGILLIITGMQLITTGFIAELLMRTYYGSQNKKPYNIKESYSAGKIDKA